jgi:hypothetical protein
VKLRLLAPTTVDFFIVPGAVDRDRTRYEHFWQEAQQALEVDRPWSDRIQAEPQILHATSAHPYNRYRTLDAHALARPLEVLELRAPSSDLPVEEESALAPLWGCAGEVRWTLFDHGVVLVETEIDLTAWLGEHASGAVHHARALTEAAVSLGEHAAHCGREVVSPIVEWLRPRSGASEIVMPRLEAASRSADDCMHEPLWVARSLVVDDPGEHAGLVHSWVRAGIGPDAAGRVGAFVAGEESHLAEWLTYAYRSEAETADLWQAMRNAQFFYAAMELADTRLSAILARSLAVDTVWELNELRSSLERMSRRAQLISMEQRDVSKYLTRSVLREMERVLAEWGYEDVLEASATTKAAACQERIAELDRKRSARSALYTDLILLGIGVTSVVSTAVGLAEFGRVMASDRALSGYDVGRNDALSWFSAQPADAILLVSGVLSVFLIVVYLVLRRSQDT